MFRNAERHLKGTVLTFPVVKKKKISKNWGLEVFFWLFFFFPPGSQNNYQASISLLNLFVDVRGASLY